MAQTSAWTTATLEPAFAFLSTPLGIALVAAIGSLLAGLTGQAISGWVLTRNHNRRVAADQQLARDKFTFDCELAQRKYDFDRELADWRRKTELAEQVLADFYQARSIFQAARHPAGYAHEGATRPNREGEDDGVRQVRDALYAPLERLTREATFLSGVHARRFRLMALLGPTSAEPFQVLLAARNRVAFATSVLLREGDRLLPEARYLRAEADIWGVGDEDDEIARDIDAAVGRIEAICAPVLNVRAGNGREGAS